VAERLRVATLNTLYYPQGDRWRQRLPLAGAALRELAADLVGLQEVDRTAARDVSLAALAPDRAYAVIRASETQRNRYPRHWDGVVTLAAASAGRIEAHHARRLTHRRIVQAIDLRTSDGSLVRFVNTHLQHGDGSPAFAVRARQVRALLDWLAQIGGGRGAANGEILVGDLNATPDEPALAVLHDAGFRSAYVQAHGTAAPTFASGLVASSITPGPPRVCIDYVLVRGRIRVIASELAFDHPSADDPTLYPSDHLGLVADLEVGQTAGPG
jgi:endonuclease/exonuclease/phosphatase family metal-dependent hydrolase